MPAPQAAPKDQNEWHADRLDENFQPRHPSGQADDEDDEFEFWRAPELAVALHAAGRRGDAQRLCSTVARDECDWAAQDAVEATTNAGPWQARHVRERTQLVRALVAAAPASGTLR